MTSRRISMPMSLSICTVASTILTINLDTIVLVLAVSLFSTVAYAEAEEIDLAEYSLDELVALYTSVRAELSSRLELIDNDSLIGRGVYIVGTDIKAGRYVLTVYETDTNYAGDRIDNSVSIWSGKEGDSDLLMWETDIPVGESFVVSLTDGQTFKVLGCLCTIAVSNAIWAP